MRTDLRVSYLAQSSAARWRFAILGLLLLTAGLHVMGICRPLTGAFATKNVVYAMIARNWAEGRATLLYPTLDCLKGGQRSLHMLEFPAAAYLAGWGWKTFGGSLDAWGRGQAAVFCLASVVLLFILVRRHHGPIAAATAATALALAPLSLIYGQSFMLESSLVCFVLGAVAGLERWLESGRYGWLLAFCVSLALALLTKIYAVVFLLPLAATITAAVSGPPRRWLAAAFTLLLALLLAGLWYVHAARTAAPASPLAARVYYSVRDSAEVHRPPHPVLRTTAFYRHVVDDLAGVVLTPIGLGLLGLGFLHRAWRRYVWWLTAAALLVLLLPRKFFEMNYYWMVVLPGLCVLIGLGAQLLVRRRVLGLRAATAVLAVTLGFSLRYAAGPLWTTAPEDRGVLAAAAAADRLTPPDAPLVTMHGTTIDLLYYCRRPGWALDPQTHDLPELVAACQRDGARYLVIAGAAQEAALPQGLSARRAESGAGWAVFELTR